MELVLICTAQDYDRFKLVLHPHPILALEHPFERFGELMLAGHHVWDMHVMFSDRHTHSLSHSQSGVEIT